MVRLIVSDIDGTLVPEGGKLEHPEAYMSIIRELTDRGVVFGVASGRQISSIDAMFHQVKDRIYYLTDNGALVVKNDEAVQTMYMDADALREFWQEARTIPRCHVFLSGVQRCYINEYDTPFARLVLKEYQLGATYVERMEDYLHDVIKISIYSEDGSRYLYHQLYDRWHNRFQIAMSGTYWLDVNDLKTCKGNAVRSLQKRHGITREETVVFGDNYNDISMLRQAGRGYVPVHAHEDIRREGTHLVAGYREDGVLHVLEELLEEVKRG